MTFDPFVDGFLFGVRVGNYINGNTVDIKWDAITHAVAELSAGHTTIQSTGAELRPQLPGITNIEHLVHDNISYDQSLAKLLLDHLRMRDPHMGQGNTSS